jgi:hypothetical protein
MHIRGVRVMGICDLCVRRIGICPLGLTSERVASWRYEESVCRQVI